MNTWRLLDTGALPARLNMGIDLALLELHAQGLSPATLRFYQWSPPAISLGYFQRRHGINLAACRKMGLDIVRRATGGHAVLHGNDLTYSVIAGALDRVPRKLVAAYELLSGGLQAGFRLMDIETERGNENLPATHTDACFMRFALGDLLHKGKKFVGSAQAWKGSSLMQHGSIILEPQVESWVSLLAGKNSDVAELRHQLISRTSSLAEITGSRVEPKKLKSALIAGMSATLKVKFQPGELSDVEWALARDIASSEACSYASKGTHRPLAHA